MSDGRRILVTGAAGFVGGRVVEVLHALGRGSVVAGVRRWSSAARIGRLPVEIVRCDVTDIASVTEAARDATHIVHCAVGTDATNVAGTQTVLEVARRLGVKRVVHVSTIDVYGRETGEVAEDASLRRTGAVYGDTKIAAEEACRAALAEGVPVAIVRPTIIYGPFSALWTIEFAERLQQPSWPFPREHASGICNAVYVDDVVHGILRCLQHESAVGEAFNINGPEWPTWYEYFERLNAALGLPPIRSASSRSSQLHALAMQPVRNAAKLALRGFQPQIMALYQRSALAKRAMKRVEGLIRSAPTTGEFRLYGRSATFPTTKAEQAIGFVPRFGLDEGIRYSAAWLHHCGYVRSSSPL